MTRSRIQIISLLVALVLMPFPGERNIFAHQTPGAPAGGSPRAVISSTSFDFGDVYRGEVISQVFVIKNVGDADLTLELKSSCGCEVLESDRVIPPGKEGKAVIEVNTATQSGGQMHKIATLRTNDPGLSSVSLMLTANILTGAGGGPVESVQLKPGKYVGPVFVSPQTRWVINALPGQKAVFEFLISAEKGNVHLNKVESESSQVTCRLEALDAGRKYKVVVESIPASKPAQIHDSFRVYTDNPALPWFPLQVLVRVAERRR
jgi:hypothetical protein